MGLFEDLNTESINKQRPTKPDEVFSSLNQEPGYDYLRSIQKSFLDQWYQRRDDKDLIGILGTGTGKTLIGLLTLQSHLNSGDGPCAYVCPT
ncbi:DEAD/DEAH box helicase family protein [Oenococcus sp.]|uniref:DEAD/DEAH box helicase family protein n=1 Tax=Oenococcus sp. TaxID=1979414 RepID=UPI0039ED5E4D